MMLIKNAPESVIKFEILLIRKNLSLVGVGSQNLAGEAGCLARNTLVPRN